MEKMVTNPNQRCKVLFYEGDYQYSVQLVQLPTIQEQLFNAVSTDLDRQWNWRATEKNLWCQVCDEDGVEVFRCWRGDIPGELVVRDQSNGDEFLTFTSGRDCFNVLKKY